VAVQGDFERARSIAYRLLSVRSHSQHELADKLRRKGLDDAVIREVVNLLLQYGMLDDAAYARGYIRQRMYGKPTGRAKLAWELKQRGIDGDIIESQLAGIDPEMEYKAAFALARRKMDGNGGDFPIARTASYLWRRGFDGDTIARVCRRLADRVYSESP
jgi:regulatory protein